VPPRNLEVDGFVLHPKELAPDQGSHFERISPTTLIHDGGKVLSASDDWPFLYLRGRLIPDLTIRSMVVLGLVGLGMVYLFLPKGQIALNGRMFFLGAAFMLLETRAVVQITLLFGSTWLVNSAVFFTVLTLILLANLYVFKMPRVRLFWHYTGLLMFLAAGVVIPVDVFLSGGILWRYAAPCILALGPMLFAGVIFAGSFRDASNPDLAFGSNIAGAAGVPAFNIVSDDLLSALGLVAAIAAGTRLIVASSPAGSGACSDVVFFGPTYVFNTSVLGGTNPKNSKISGFGESRVAKNTTAFSLAEVAPHLRGQRGSLSARPLAYNSGKLDPHPGVAQGSEPWS
jgi:hypothetical protein